MPPVGSAHSSSQPLSSWCGRSQTPPDAAFGRALAWKPAGPGTHPTSPTQPGKSLTLSEPHGWEEDDYPSSAYSRELLRIK